MRKANNSKVEFGKMSYAAGHAAEDVVAHHYKKQGADIAAQRWRGKRGEIDIILNDNGALIFVEVKKSRSFAQAAARLSRRQQGRICAAAEEYLATQPQGQLTPMRMDAALVNQTGEVQILENAFMA